MIDVNHARQRKRSLIFPQNYLNLHIWFYWLLLIWDKPIVCYWQAENRRITHYTLKTIDYRLIDIGTIDNTFNTNTRWLSFKLPWDDVCDVTLYVRGTKWWDSCSRLFLQERPALSFWTRILDIQLVFRHRYHSSLSTNKSKQKVPSSCSVNYKINLLQISLFLSVICLLRTSWRKAYN